MDTEETTLVRIRGSNQAVNQSDPFINSALIYTASACLIFFVVFIFVLPAIVLTTIRRESIFGTDNRPVVPESREVYNSQQRGPGQPVIMCFINSTSQDREPPLKYTLDHVPSSWCSYVVYPLTAGADWTEDMFQFDYTHKITHPNLYKDMVRLKRAKPSVKILLSVGEHTASGRLFQYAAESMHTTIQFSTAVVRWTLGNGFDGLVIHNLFPAEVSPDRHKVIILLQKLWVNFERRGLILGVVFEPDSDVLQHEQVAARLSAFVDLAIIVSHGFRNPMFTDFASPMRSSPSNDTLDFRTAIGRAIASGIPRKKLVPTVSFDGTTYTLEDATKHDPGSLVQAGRGLGGPGSYTKTPGMLSYFEICKNVNTANWTREWDDVAECPFAYGDDQWVSYEDKDSLTAKAKYVHNESLAGVCVWDVTSDDYNGDCGEPHVLIKTLHERFYKSMLTF